MIGALKHNILMELAKNKKAFFDYEIMEEFEAGMMLHGHEVKSIRAKKVNLLGSHISIRDGEAWLENVQITPYQPKNQPEENGNRKRKLLLQKKEIATIENQSANPGVTIIPLKILLKNHRLKLIIGVCRGKKQHDKRNIIKNRDLTRELRRGLK